MKKKEEKQSSINDAPQLKIDNEEDSSSLTNPNTNNAAVLLKNKELINVYNQKAKTQQIK